MIKNSRKRKKQNKKTRKTQRNNKIKKMAGGEKMTREEFEQHLRGLLNNIPDVSPQFLDTITQVDIDELFTKYSGYNDIQRINNELITLLNYINLMPENMRPETFSDLLNQLDDDTTIETINEMSDISDSDMSFGGKRITNKRRTKKYKKRK